MTNPWERDWSAAPSAPANPWERDWSSVSSDQSDTPSRLEAFGYNAADAASFGLGDEAAGALAGAGAVLGGGDYALAYRRRVDAARQRLEAAREAHPVTSMLGTVVGATGTFLIPGGLAATGARLGVGGLQTAGRVGQALATGRALPFGSELAAMAAGRGWTAAGSQVVLGAMQGAAFGGLYGAGSANDGDRLGGAVEGAKTGAILGGLTPPVLQGLTRGHAGENLFAAGRSALQRAGAGALGGGALGFASAAPGEDRMEAARTGALFGEIGRAHV